MLGRAWRAIERRLPHGRQAVVSAVGGFCGFMLLAWLSEYLGQGHLFPALAAPMGASAVLLFGSPQSPLSQPRVVLVSHLVAAFIGITALQRLPGACLPAAIAVAGTLLAMRWLRCMHPPAGATALFAVIGGPSIQRLGYQYLLTPVLLDVLLLLLAAWLILNLLPGHRYPHRAAVPAGGPDAAGAEPVCADLMVGCRLVLPAASTAGQAWSEMMHRRVSEAPVVDARGALVGTLSLTALLKPAAAGFAGGSASMLPEVDVRTPVSVLMRADVAALGLDDPLRRAAAVFSEKGPAVLPVVDAAGRPAGLVTRRDVLASMAGRAAARRSA